MAELPFIEDDEDLVPLLRRAPDAMLEPLVGYITDGGKGRVTAQLTDVEAFRAHTPEHHQYADEIAAELQKFGGNTVANLVRGGRGVRYREVAGDVAAKLGVKASKSAPVDLVEQRVLLKVLEKAYERMDDGQRRGLLEVLGAPEHGSVPTALPVLAVQGAITASGFVAYRAAVIVANAVAKAMLGRGLALTANVALVRAMSVFAGPIGLALTGIWAAIDLAGPAYRVTVPSVIQVATIRLAEQAKGEGAGGDTA